MKLTSYLDDFNARINVTGKTIKDSQFHSTQRFIESTFADSPFYRIAKWNGADLEVRLADVNSITRSNQIMPVQYGIKFCFFKPNIVMDLGELFDIDGTNWMVVDFTSENTLFPKAKLQICNYDLQVKISETKTLVGYDNYNAPVYDITPTYATLPSIIKNTVGSVDLNQAINLPSEKTFITVKYDNVSMYIKEDDTFTLYRNYDLQHRDYKVVGIDYSNVFSEKGIITLIMERVVNP